MDYKLRTNTLVMASRPSNVEDTINDLRDSLPRREWLTLVKNGTSLQQTIQARAIAESGAEAGDEVAQWWLPEQGFVVIDLNGGDDGTE